MNMQSQHSFGALAIQPVHDARSPAGGPRRHPWAGRRLDQVDTADLLRRMGSLRSEVGRVRHQLRVGSIPDLTLASLLAMIDRSAELITGDAVFLEAA